MMYKKVFSLIQLIGIGFLLLFAGHAVAQNNGQAQKKKYDVAAFLYPAYASDDPRLRPFWPSGIGEWETVTSIQARYPGHYWTETSYLEPDNIYGYGYLDAVKSIFVKE